MATKTKEQLAMIKENEARETARKQLKAEKRVNALKLWRELKVDKVGFNFSCGGDSMNDTDISMFDKEGNIVLNDELESYFNDATYDNVQFYVNSDGHYQGESGVVYITLYDDDADDFDYSKSSTSEWNESVESVIKMKLSKAEEKFITNKVFNINGGEGNCTINFKEDFILTDKEEKLLELLEEKIEQFTGDFCPEDIDEVDEWYSFTTNEDGEELEVIDGELKIQIRNQYTAYKEGDEY
jgi:hypothetical protein